MQNQSTADLFSVSKCAFNPCLCDYSNFSNCAANLHWKHVILMSKGLPLQTQKLLIFYVGFSPAWTLKTLHFALTNTKITNLSPRLFTCLDIENSALCPQNVFTRFLWYTENNKGFSLKRTDWLFSVIGAHLILWAEDFFLRVSLIPCSNWLKYKTR